MTEVAPTYSHLWKESKLVNLRPFATHFPWRSAIAVDMPESW
jgi:hypothetical protein